ncbi:uncharacterized protein yc1106_09602 [Curvularia clavata]|uniref:Uncharacterized protein n=1 Tax=Curvularia clavata TaxID=95742 RepID=A0A9Q9DVL6_CURCL|nr:uncharacterized protein yc1106_09602 [Curvularia clavata]
MPPYFDRTELYDARLAPPHGELQEKLKAKLEQPISDDELESIVSLYDLPSILYPDYFYLKEAQREESRLNKYWSNEIFQGLEGSRRRGVFVRHNVKRRWEKLGVWNLEWGFAGRNVQPNDNAYEWEWRWEPKFADGSASAGFPRREYMQHLVERALRLRQNLRRGEKAPLLPRSRLDEGATTSQAESFLISRPWFIFQVELAEERIRYFRLSLDEQNQFPYSSRKQVIEWWKEREDWREEFDRNDLVTSWKWRHESPSPEPEDLAPIKNMRDSPLDTTDMDFTPSEVDVLETIERPSSEQPKGFWYIPRELSFLKPSFPGQLREPFQPPPVPPGHPLYLPPGSVPKHSPFCKTPPPEEEEGKVIVEEYEDLQQELEQNPEPRHITKPPTQRPQHQHEHRLQDKLDSAQDRDQPPPLARCSGMQQETEGRSTKFCNAYRSAYRTGDSRQEDKARPSANSIKNGERDPIRARAGTSKKGEWTEHAFFRDKKNSGSNTHSSQCQEKRGGGNRHTSGNKYASGASARGEIAEA